MNFTNSSEQQLGHCDLILKLLFVHFNFKPTLIIIHYFQLEFRTNYTLQILLTSIN